MKIDTEIYKLLVRCIADLEIWWTVEGRFQVLKEAGLRSLIPVLHLEGTAQITAGAVVRELEYRNAEVMRAFLLALAAHADASQQTTLRQITAPPR
ncbi:MAG: hypothetical protein H0X24_12090 [Ktedonobacterales bacterium]|nr:hypothetical protein [Ktedonobacterales bacterium]